MRKAVRTIDSVRGNIESLKGCDVDMMVDYGRKRIVNTQAVVVGTYPSMFTARFDNNLVSFSYSDVLCGNVAVSARSCGVTPTM